MNYTNWNTVTNATSFLQVANTNSGGWFWSAVYFMIIIVMFMAMINFGAEAALLTSLFGGIILGILLLYMDLISTIELGIVIGGLLFYILYLMYFSPKNQ